MEAIIEMHCLCILSSEAGMSKETQNDKEKEMRGERERDGF